MAHPLIHTQTNFQMAHHPWPGNDLGTDSLAPCHYCTYTLWLQASPVQNGSSHLKGILHLYSPISPFSHLFVSHSAQVTAAVLARSKSKHAGPHLSQTNLFWFHLTKECAANIHQPVFRLFPLFGNIYSCIFVSFCDFFLVYRHWLHTKSVALFGHL